MDIMTKVRVLWEKVAGITADVSAVDAKATATAATLAGILPRIPADYSENETATGVKWVDGKEIFMKYYSISETLSSGDIDTIAIDTFVNSISHISYVTGEETTVQIAATQGLYTSSAYIRISYNETDEKLQYTSGGAFIGAALGVVIYYTKPDPVPAQADNETKKRKTKKEEK